MLGKTLVEDIPRFKRDLNMNVSDFLVEFQLISNKVKAASIPLPAGSFSLASRFNETVSIDIKQFGPNLFVLHFIDHLSGYSSACLIQNEKKETIVNGIRKYWINI